MTRSTGKRVRLYGRRPPGLLCVFEGCERPQAKNVYCGMHYSRWKKYGDPSVVKQAAPRRSFPVLTRLADKFLVGDGCWEWQGVRDRNGYGRFWMNEGNRSAPAHRVAYEQYVGPVPDGLVLDHLCRNTACVRFSHLEPVTVGENSRRGARLSAARRERGTDGRFN